MSGLDWCGAAIFAMSGAAAVLVGIGLGFWLAFRERVNYGRDRFEAGIASGIAWERQEAWKRSQGAQR